MIYVRDKGRLCNNILQYGHLYAWGREYNRPTVSMRFCYKYPWFSISRSPRHNFLRYLAGKYGAKLHLLPVVSFDTPGMDCTPGEKQLLAHRNIVAQGWEVRFYDLFLKYKKDIISLFSFLPEISAKTDGYLLQNAPEGTRRIGIHIRRGDYAKWQGGRYLYDDATYLSIIRQIIDLDPSRPTAVFICGNDPDLDRDLFTRSLPVPVFFPDGNPAEDLSLLSRCDLLAGAPSTFSLVASMYHDVPLYWIKDPEAPVTKSSFSTFDTLFRQII